jgi:hypothetical protein
VFVLSHVKLKSHQNLVRADFILKEYYKDWGKGLSNGENALVLTSISFSRVVWLVKVIIESKCYQRGSSLQEIALEYTRVEFLFNLNYYTGLQSSGKIQEFWSITQTCFPIIDLLYLLFLLPGALCHLL